MFSFGKKQAFISEDRKVKLISDVDSLVPEKLKKLFFLIEEIIETDENSLLSVCKKIEVSREPIDSIYSVIEYALNIRPLNTKSLISLHCFLSQKHGYESINTNNSLIYSMLLNQGIIPKQNKKVSILKENQISVIFMQDDIDSFIKKSSKAEFNPKSKMEIDYNSSISFVKENYELSYLQIMAFLWCC